MFGVRLKELRLEKKFTQDDLSKILGVSDRAIGYYESGARHPDFEGLKKLAQFFDVSTDYLLGRTNDRKLDLQDPCNLELESYLKYSNIRFDGAPLEEQDKEDLLDFLRIIWNRKKNK